MVTVPHHRIVLVTMVGEVLVVTFLCVMPSVAMETALEEQHNVNVTQDGLVLLVTSSLATRVVLTATAVDPINAIVTMVGKAHLVIQQFAQRVVLKEIVLLQTCVLALLDGGEPTALKPYVMQVASMELALLQTIVSVTLISTEQDAISHCATLSVPMELAWKIQLEDPITVSVHRAGVELTVPALCAHSMDVYMDSAQVQMTAPVMGDGPAETATWISQRLLPPAV